MKTLTISVFILTVSILIVAFRQPDTSAYTKTEKTYPGFAVLELFTSEGCSSCPSADALVGKIQKEYKDKPVYILSFHVDYWNRLGWRDVFSDPAFTKRQQQYASIMKLPSVYTPQAIVDGNTEFVGSQEATMRKAIAEGLNSNTTTQIVFENIKAGKEQISLDYHIDGDLSNASLVLALVQKTAESKVRAGENAGRILSHVQIARRIQNIVINEKNTGKAFINVPDNLKNIDLEVIGFLQNTENGKITAANRAALIQKI
ncbi:thioredoxin family protein [Dyadobacter sp. 3J3]|uniref:DUF1223 domain-containing protein n=1 Tax=Dyadobacter sp. 3J3 TaxID=2606600 RepID=UPI00135CB031|nr:DUF1223 domain-containing protein [Dyadobacter sp. 3J3]